jgi:hypothetical protein
MTSNQAITKAFFRGLYSIQSWPKQPQTILVPKSLAYICFGDLLDERGTPVPRSKAGKSFGNRFFDIPLDANKVECRLTQTTAGHSLPPPAKLFEIDKPVTYTLRLQFQVYHKFAKDKPAVLVRFPPIDYPVYK